MEAVTAWLMNKQNLKI